MSKLDLLRRYFFNREDVVANLDARGKPCPILTDEKIELVLRAHLGDTGHKARNRVAAVEGRHHLIPVLRVGAYTPGVDGRSKWLCVDFDGAGHAHALREPLVAAEMMMERCKAAGVPAYLERSGGGRGWHVWIFFERSIKTATARALGLSLVPRGMELLDGRVADPEKSHGIEVFPKMTEHDPERTGHMVWLPWWHGAPEGSNQFHAETPEGPVPYAPKEFELASIERCATWVKANPPPTTEQLEFAERTRETRAAPKGGNDDWDEWKRTILEVVPLQQVFRLTGKRDGKGWLEARDPSSESGDKHPSASVSDGSDGRTRGLFYSHITGESLNVFDYLIKYEGFADFLSAARHLASIANRPLPERRSTLDHQFEMPPPPSDDDVPFGSDEEPPPPSDEDAPPELRGEAEDRVDINVKEDERDIAAKAWQAIVDVPVSDQEVFLWNDELVSMFKRRNGSVGQRIVSAPALRLLVANRVRWVKYITTGKGFEAKPAHAPGTTISAMRERPDRRLPEISTITSVPVFGPNGELIHKRGYDVDSGVYCWPTCNVDPVPAKPNMTDLGHAHDLIFNHVLGDFRFARVSDRAHAVAAMITPFVRLMINGPAPVFVFEAPVAGSGKSRIAQIASIVFSGEARSLKLKMNDDENEKTILALLKDAPSRIMFFDNVTIALTSSTLSQVLTSTHIEGRILGLSQGVVARNLATWMLTANNPDTIRDLNRRSLVSRLDTGLEHPDQRPIESFRHPFILSWVTQHRAELAWAICTMVQHWIATGAKLSPITIGSFEEYAGIIGGILAANGVDGFAQNRNDQMREPDEWHQIVPLWWEAFRDRVVNVSDLLHELREDDDRSMYGGKGRGFKVEMRWLERATERGQLTAFGAALRKAMDRIVDGYKIKREGTGWQLIEVEPHRVESKPAHPISDPVSIPSDSEQWDWRN